MDPNEVMRVVKVSLVCESKAVYSAVKESGESGVGDRDDYRGGALGRHLTRIDYESVHVHSEMVFDLVRLQLLSLILLLNNTNQSLRNLQRG